MYNRAFPVGNALFFFAGEMSLFRLPCGKFSLPFFAVPAGKDGRVERPCQTVDDFIGVNEARFDNHFNKKRSCQFYTGKSVSCVIQKYRQG